MRAGKTGSAIDPDANADPDAHTNSHPDPNAKAPGRSPAELPQRGVPVYLAMPELANQLGFAMIDNYDARMGGGAKRSCCRAR